MKETELLDSEKVITTSSDKQITLTNHRLRKVVGSSGNGTFTSILLRNVSSIYMVSTRKNIYFILGILALGGASLLAFQNEEEIAIGSGILGVLFIIFFILSKSHSISVASSGGARINLTTKGMKDSSILDFINKIEAAIIQEELLNWGNHEQ